MPDEPTPEQLEQARQQREEYLAGYDAIFDGVAETIDPVADRAGFVAEARKRAAAAGYRAFHVGKLQSWLEARQPPEPEPEPQ